MRGANPLLFSATLGLIILVSWGPMPPPVAAQTPPRIDFKATVGDSGHVRLTWNDTKGGNAQYLIVRTENPKSPTPARVQFPVPEGDLSFVDASTVNGAEYKYSLFAVTGSNYAPSPLADVDSVKIPAITAVRAICDERNLVSSANWERRGGAWLVDGKTGAIVQNDDSPATTQADKRLARVLPPSLKFADYADDKIQLTASVTLTGWDDVANLAASLKTDPQFRIGIGLSDGSWEAFLVFVGDSKGREVQIENGKGQSVLKKDLIEPEWPFDRWKDGKKFWLKLRIEKVNGNAYFSAKFWNDSEAEPADFGPFGKGPSWSGLSDANKLRPVLYGGIQAVGDGKVKVSFDDICLELFPKPKTTSTTSPDPTCAPEGPAACDGAPVAQQPILPALAPPKLDRTVCIPRAALTETTLGRWGTLISRSEPDPPIMAPYTPPLCLRPTPTSSTPPECGCLSGAAMPAMVVPWTGFAESPTLAPPPCATEEIQEAAPESSPDFMPSSSPAPTVGRTIRRTAYNPETESSPNDATAEVEPRREASKQKQAGPGLQLVSSWGAESGVPTRARNLIIVGTDERGLLHVRTFDAAGVRADTFEALDQDDAPLLRTVDSSGKIVSDRLKSSLPARLVKALDYLRHVTVNGGPKEQIIKEAKSIVAQPPTCDPARDADALLKLSQAPATLRDLRDFGAVATVPHPTRDEEEAKAETARLQINSLIRIFLIGAYEQAIIELKSSNSEQVKHESRILEDILDTSDLDDNLARLRESKHYTEIVKNMGESLNRADLPKEIKDQVAARINELKNRELRLGTAENIRESTTKAYTARVDSRIGLPPAIPPPTFLGTPGLGGSGGGGGSGACRVGYPRDPFSMQPRVTVIPQYTPSGSDIMGGSDSHHDASWEPRPPADELSDSPDGRVWTYHFDHPARFPMVKAGGERCLFEGEGAVIHEGMRLLARQDGQYEVRFNITAPSTPVVVKLQLILFLDKPESGHETIPRTLTLPPILLRANGPNDFPNNLQGGFDPTSYQVSVRGYSQVVHESHLTERDCMLLVKRIGTARFGSGSRFWTNQ